MKPYKYCKECQNKLKRKNGIFCSAKCSKSYNKKYPSTKVIEIKVTSSNLILYKLG